MRLPWVNRELYENMRDLLSKQLDVEREERRKILDYLQVHSLGTPIFSALPEKPKEPEAPKRQPLTADDILKDQVRRAREAGYTKPRAIADFITRDNEARSADRRRQRVMNPQIPLHQQTQPTVGGFEDAKNEGVAAAEAAMARGEKAAEEING